MHFLLCHRRVRDDSIIVWILKRIRKWLNERNSTRLKTFNATTIVCYQIMTFQVQLPSTSSFCARIRTHDLWIRKWVCYPLHHSASQNYSTCSGLTKPAIVSESPNSYQCRTFWWMDPSSLQLNIMIMRGAYWYTFFADFSHYWLINWLQWFDAYSQSVIRGLLVIEPSLTIDESKSALGLYFHRLLYQLGADCLDRYGKLSRRLGGPH